MSSIQFDASLNTAQLESAIKQSNKTIGEWSKGVEKAGGQADAGLGKMTKSFKDAIKEQKELIKSIEQDVKKLQKAYDDAAAGKAKSAMGEQVGMAKRALTEERARLDQLQKAQIEANKAEEGSIGSLVGKLKSWVLGLATVGAAMKIAKSIIDSTESTTHAFEVVTAEATAGIGYFFKAIASGDWSNFRDGLTKAMNGARDFVNAMEDIQNRTNEQKIKSSEISSQIAELRAGTFDRDIENNDKLITNLKEIIGLQKQDYGVQAVIAADTYKETLKTAALNNRIDKDKLDTLISEYTKNKEIIELGEKYNVLQVRLNAARKSTFNAPRIAEIKAEIAALGEGAEAAGKMAEKYGKVPMPLRASLAQLKADQIRLEGLAKIGSKFDERRLATAENLKKTTEEDAKKKAIEDAKTENQIKIQQELLNKAIEDNNATEIKAIGKRIAELKKELEVREKISKQVIEAASYEGFVPTQISTRGMKVPSVIPKAKSPTTQKTFDEIRKEMTSLRPISQKLIDADKEADRRGIEAGKLRIENQKQLIAGASELVYLAGQQLGLSEEELKVLDEKLQVIGQFASGNYVGAAISTVLSVVSSFMSLIPNQSAKLEAQMEHINQLLEEQQRLIDLSERRGGGEAARKGELELLKEQLAAQEAALKKAQDYLDPYKFKLFRSQAGMKRAAQQVEELTLAIKDSQNAIDDASQGLTDFLTGGITENTLAAAIAQGFQEGKTSIDDFGDYMNQVLLDAIMEVFKAEMLGPAMTELSKQISDSLSDKILTSEEKQAIDQKVKTIAETNRELWDNLTRGIDLGNGPQAGLSGIVRQMSEDTGNELTGLFRRFADDERVVKDYSILGVKHLIGIEANTMNTVLELQKANIKLDTVITNTKQIPAGALG